MLKNFIKMPLDILEWNEDKKDFLKIKRTRNLVLNINQIIEMIWVRDYEGIQISTTDRKICYVIPNMAQEEFLEYCNKQIHANNFNSKMDNLLKEDYNINK